MLLLVAFALLFVLPGPWNGVGFGLCLAAFLGEILFWNRTVKHRRAYVGAQTLIGSQGTALTACRPEGQITLSGEIWKARCKAGVGPGQVVKVVGRDRLTLLVEPVVEAHPALQATPS
ncbi:MAG TPA: NfeD family protein [Gaiellaceae bacterium]